MAECKNCGEIVIFLRRSDGSWAPPVEPVTDFATGEYVLMGPMGTEIPFPQVFKKHRCVAEEGLTEEERDLRRVQREIERADKLAERERLITEATAKREALAFEQEQRIQAERQQRTAVREAQQEQRELLARQEEEFRIAQRQNERRESQRTLAVRYLNERHGSVPCPECGAEVKEPCRSSRPDQYYVQNPHPGRRKAAPPAPLRPQRRRWGDDYDGSWPPLEHEDPSGLKIMRRWLRANAEIFNRPTT